VATDQNNDLASFHAFVAKQLQNDGPALTPEQVLALWRERDETIAAVREGLQAVEDGATKSLDKFKSDFESRHNIGTE
jgi:hypothetical protein